MGVSSAAFGFPPANVARTQQSHSAGAAAGSHGHPPRARVPMGTGLNTMGGIVGGAPEEVSSAALLVQMQLQRTTGESRPQSLMQTPQTQQQHLPMPTQAPLPQQQPTSARAGSQHHGAGGHSPGGSSSSSGAGMGNNTGGGVSSGSQSLIPGLPGDRAEQERIIQAAALLGMDPLQLAQLKQLATQVCGGWG
jgi:hypothetical protein